jgi:hypothetical protein
MRLDDYLPIAGGKQYPFPVFNLRGLTWHVIWFVEGLLLRDAKGWNGSLWKALHSAESLLPGERGAA